MAEHLPSRMTHAYVLINVDPTRTEAVVERLSAIPGSRVHEVLGPYDIVVELESEAPEYITRILREKIRHVPGVTSTVTCTWVE
ncbi:MAG: Lrp/AsnC ligand binding domain-containing protein [Dehalococcoidia bacterium]